MQDVESNVVKTKKTQEARKDLNLFTQMICGNVVDL